MKLTARLLLLVAALVMPASAVLATTPDDPLPITVWIYGDGAAHRVGDALALIVPADVTIVNKAIGATSPVDLDAQLDTDLPDPSAPRPDVVVIGYAASVGSLWDCLVHGGLFDPAIAQLEADAIVAAAARLEAEPVSVILTKGSGVPIRTPELAGQPIPVCIEKAVQLVWETTRATSIRHVDWSLPRDQRELWDVNAIDLSCETGPECVDPGPGAGVIARRILAALEDLR